MSCGGINISNKCPHHSDKNKCPLYFW